MHDSHNDVNDFMGSLGPLDFDDVPELEENEDGLIEGPVMALLDMVPYPRMIVPLFITSKQALAALDAALDENDTLICLAHKHPLSDKPKTRPKDVFTTGTEVALGRSIRMPDESTGVLVQGRSRIEVVEFTQTSPYLRARVRRLPEEADDTLKTEALMHAVLAQFEQCVSLSRSLPENTYVFAMNIDQPGWLADMIVASLPLDLAERQRVLEIANPAERLEHVSTLLAKELEMLQLEEEIHNRAQDSVDGMHREIFLREQMRAIQTELGETDFMQQELADLRKKIIKARLPKEANDRAMKELGRLAAMPPMAPEVGIIRSYLDLLLELPWTKTSEDNLDIKQAAKTLDEYHYGLPKAKERILEHIAVRQLAKDKMKTPILCFVGPPGTGKTSMGKSIAEALGREFVRVSLGGVRDEAEIRGHRRTYIGALPGRIISTVRRAGTINPVFMLDEVDKLGADYRGDPSAALLEVLDPEQNNTFADHYLDLPYDLSKVFFITTANYLDPIPPALEDRMEIIEFPGYTQEEKIAIARRFLIPRQMEAHGLDKHAPQLHFTEKALVSMIRHYTWEAGVRNLERELANVCRKIARQVAEKKRFAKTISDESLARYLGPPQHIDPLAEEKDEVGVATGLAWTQGGGDLLSIEVTLMPGKGGMTLTGQLGDVMQESAQAALSYTRSQARNLKISATAFDKYDIHLHVPEGAIPKDGPSAGITLALALISAFTGRKVRREVAMTGEITLRGRVLPVGGIKEKTLAAHRFGLKTVAMPRKNEKDLVDVPDNVKKALDIVLVDSMDEVLKLALLPKPRKQSASKKKVKATAKTPKTGASRSTSVPPPA